MMAKRVEECPPSVSRTIAIRPALHTIEEVSEEEERAEELNWDDSYEEEDEEENGLDETTLFPHQSAEDNSTAQKPPLTDTNVHSERTSLQVEHSCVSVAELTVCQPKCPDTAAQRRQRRNWKDVSRLSRSAVEYAPPIARKVAVKPTLYTIEEVSEDEERAEELNWDESYEEEDDEENGLDEATLFSHPNAENNSTAQKPPLPDTHVLSERTSLLVEHSSASVAELAACQPTCTDTASRRRQRRNWKDVSRLSRPDDCLLYETESSDEYTYYSRDRLFIVFTTRTWDSHIRLQPKFQSQFKCALNSSDELRTSTEGGLWQVLVLWIS
nr:unnamed protein product [Spirometra erinaceieuropaei]